MKETRVELIARIGGVPRSFEFSHAERLLRMKNNGGWRLPPDSQYEFDGNEIKYRENKGRAEEPEKKGGDRKSRTATSKA